jgi:hypothetical protein
MIETWNELISAGFPREHMINEAERHLRNLHDLEEISCTTSFADIDSARIVVNDWINEQKKLIEDGNTDPAEAV